MKSFAALSMILFTASLLLLSASCNKSLNAMNRMSPDSKNKKMSQQSASDSSDSTSDNSDDEMNEINEATGANSASSSFSAYIEDATKIDDILNTNTTYSNCADSNCEGDWRLVQLRCNNEVVKKEDLKIDEDSGIFRIKDGTATRITPNGKETHYSYSSDKNYISLKLNDSDLPEETILHSFAPDVKTLILINNGKTEQCKDGIMNKIFQQVVAAP